VNAPAATSYLYQDLDAAGRRLSGSNHYTVTLCEDSAPPTYGFWSLTLYDADHFFVPNEAKRWALAVRLRCPHEDKRVSTRKRANPRLFWCGWQESNPRPLGS
jgi:hypothetical protein